MFINLTWKRCLCYPWHRETRQTRHRDTDDEEGHALANEDEDHNPNLPPLPPGMPGYSHEMQHLYKAVSGRIVSIVKLKYFKK